jgi:deoxycytidylate deaminase
VNSSLYDVNSLKSDVHAEANDICMAARAGVKLEGCVLGSALACSLLFILFIEV